jgi:hypothetical protein
MADFCNELGRLFPPGLERIIGLAMFAKWAMNKARQDEERAYWRKVVADCEAGQQRYRDEHKTRRDRTE